MANTVVVQKWEESERGWGTRPDGYTLHLSVTDRDSYVKEYWARMPDTVPAEYSRPAGTAYTTEVDDLTYLTVRQSANGIERAGAPPNDPGYDGWVSRK